MLKIVVIWNVTIFCFDLSLKQCFVALYDLLIMLLILCDRLLILRKYLKLSWGCWGCVYLCNDLLLNLQLLTYICYPRNVHRRILISAAFNLTYWLLRLTHTSIILIFDWILRQLFPWNCLKFTYHRSFRCVHGHEAKTNILVVVLIQIRL